MKPVYINIHTHRPIGIGIELRTAGVHPWVAGEEDLATLVPQLAQVQAIGETGLDAVRGAARDIQLKALREQLALACEHRMPVVIHCVRAFGEVMRELAACQPRAVIFHGFIGSKEQAQQALDKGYYLSFGERAFASPRTLDVLRHIPHDRLFFETDDSDTPIETIYARAAAVREETVDELLLATNQNYERIFKHG